MADQPSIESLRDHLDAMVKAGGIHEGEAASALSAAITELAALRESDASLRAENEALKARVEALEGVGLWPSTKVESTVHLMPNGETARMAVVPTWVLDEHAARVRREALEAAAKKCATAYWAMVAPRDHAAMHPTIEFWRDALGLEPMSSAEHEALAAIEPRHPEIVMVDDLAMLVRLLVHSIRKHSPDNETARKAMDYLRRHELQGSPLRTTILSPAPDAAKPNNQQEQP